MLSTRRSQSHHPDSFSSRYRAGKSKARSRDQSVASRRLHRRHSPDTPPDGSSSNQGVITLTIGPTKRLFAAHKDILCVSPYFAALCNRPSDSSSASSSSSPNPIDLPDEQPEIFSCVLEYLYRGDYYPRLRHDKTNNTWDLETSAANNTTTSTNRDTDPGATIFVPAAGAEILRDTAVYCAAQKYSLEILKRLALKKQGLHSNIPCHTILTSARYAYAHTPDNESKLRAHYLALIIRSRGTFKRSGTMQMEMEQGGKLFFDLFVAMCNHMVSL
ncbi:hypothetical protein BO94DRAFT_455177 [Aspergillus sclerotioniger CBS 115572]|uniref:BTB domain-containing protein n=1 Tax=Aspergillus sclerotioniger CBS 115572 TaxID=1450535 RepID=A0A317XAH9_9EURO|nr:hypothetical protein BO94DRAFT_455177 [Aspergillus sclerotioniger CBS 115572]PWY95593.1 hypothetical protein BO94DRAFT_455177 [Aspergillus sclerotioniger CBS 115572]